MSISNMVAVPSDPHGSPTFGGTVSSTAEVGTPAEVSAKPYSANFYSFTDPPGQSQRRNEELVNRLRKRLLAIDPRLILSTCKTYTLICRGVGDVGDP